jgi:hypothetical protein
MTNETKNGIRSCNKLTGGTLHSVETRKYIYDDQEWSAYEIGSHYKCSLTGKPCIGRITTESIKDFGVKPEKWYKVRINKELQTRCPLYNFEHYSAINLTSAIIQNCKEGTNEKLEATLNEFFLNESEEKIK